MRQFLIDNGKSLLQEYHVDGLRYDQVTVIAESGGWYFAQDLTNTLRYVKPAAVQIAEYWGNERWKGVADSAARDGLRHRLQRRAARHLARGDRCKRPAAATPASISTSCAMPCT